MMSDAVHPVPTAIDTHVHVWDTSGGPFGVRYGWLDSAAPLLRRSYPLAELDPALNEAGIDGIVLVQASDSLAETDELIRVAGEASRPARVTGWLPLTDADATLAAIHQRRRTGTLVAVRHLIHDDPDPQWMLRAEVAAGMTVLEEQSLVFEAVAERFDLLAQVPVVARRHPGMTVVLDHLGKPPFTRGSAAMTQWADLLTAAAEPPNVLAKISGLGTVSPDGWTAQTWSAAVDLAITVFGPDRLMLGGDWPVALQAGDPVRTWTSTVETLSGLDDAGRAAVLGGTAARVYSF